MEIVFASDCDKSDATIDKSEISLLFLQSVVNNIVELDTNRLFHVMLTLVYSVAWTTAEQKL